MRGFCEKACKISNNLQKFRGKNLGKFIEWLTFKFLRKIPKIYKKLTNFFSNIWTGYEPAVHLVLGVRIRTDPAVQPNRFHPTLQEAEPLGYFRLFLSFLRVTTLIDSTVRITYWHWRGPVRRSLFRPHPVWPAQTGSQCSEPSARIKHAHLHFLVNFTRQNPEKCIPKCRWNNNNSGKVSKKLVGIFNEMNIFKKDEK